MMTFWGPAMAAALLLSAVRCPLSSIVHYVNYLLLSRRLSARLTAGQDAGCGAAGGWLAAARATGQGRSVEQRADLVRGLRRLNADLAKFLRRVARRRAPDVDDRRRILPGVQHDSGHAGREFLVLAVAQRVAEPANLGEFLLEQFPVGDRVRGVARQ